MAVEPAALSFDAHGAPMSARYGDVYASRDGALGQSRHVFLGGTRTAQRWRGRAQYAVVETGFGLGVNFLAAWQAWRGDPARPRRLHFVSIERHPLDAEALVRHAPAELRPLASQLAAQWPAPVGGIHRCEFDDGRVVLSLALGDARDLAPQLRLGADALFLDGFAPDRNPEMWEPALLRALARLARPDCRVATWSTARGVSETLAAAGFAVERAPGFGRKRAMLVGRYAPRYAVRRHEPPAAYAGERRAIVVGAGLAGAACADALARRDWTVQIVDAAPPARGASALPWGAMHPHFAVDDSVLARLTRAGCAASARALERVAPGGCRGASAVWRRGGFFQQAKDPAEAARWQRALGLQRLPRGWVEWLSAHDAAARVGVRPAHDGLWWAGGCVVSPPALVTALLDAHGLAVTRAAVASLERDGGAWTVRDTRGDLVAAAPVVVVAAALDSPRLLAARALPVQSVPGQVTFVHAGALAPLRAALGGDGTLLRAPDGRIAVGATYEVPHGDAVPLDERLAARSNLARLERLLAEAVEARVAGRFCGVRCVARDRLPYAGRVADEAAAQAGAAALRGAHPADLPRRPQLFASFAHGSRGLTFAALAAELMAAQAEGEPLPLAGALVDALDPGRVLLRRLRRGTP